MLIKNVFDDKYFKFHNYYYNLCLFNVNNFIIYVLQEKILNPNIEL